MVMLLISFKASTLGNFGNSLLVALMIQNNFAAVITRKLGA